MVKFVTNASGAIGWPNLQLMQVTESISGSVVFVFVGHVKSIGSLFTGVLLNASNNNEEKRVTKLLKRQNYFQA